MTVYIDLIILANFLLDYSLICYTGIIAGEKIKKRRLVLSTLIATSSLVLFFLRVTALFVILRIIWSLVIIYTAFPFRGLLNYIKLLLLFYFLNFITAGIVVSYDFEFDSNSLLVRFDNEITWYLLIISFIFANVLTYIFKEISEKRAKLKNMLVPVEFGFLHETYVANGFIDSGCMVTSHEDHIPVVFIDRGLFHQEISEIFLIKNQVSFTYILYKTVKDRYITMAFKPEYFKLYLDHKPVDKTVYIALSDHLKNREKEFDILLNYNLLF